MKLRLTARVLSALRRPISGGIVSKWLTLNCTATRQQRVNRRRRLTFKYVSCVMANTPAGISAKALYRSCWRRRQSNDTKNDKEAHPERGHACQLRDVVGHGDELPKFKLRLTGDT